MKVRLAFTIAVAGGLLLGPTIAWGDWDAKQLKAVRAAPTSLRAAVLTAERDLKGRAFSAIANVGEGGVTYSVKLDVNDKPILAQVDGKSGKITESGPASGDALARAKEFAKVKGSLLAAMKAAEATAKGKSFAALFKRLGNKDVFEVDVAGRDDVEKDVVVDAASGKIRKVAERSADGSPAAGAAGASATGMGAMGVVAP